MLARVVGIVYPGGGPRSRISRGEVKVYEALARGLPDGWQAWHSLRLRDGNRWEGEGDFVIADPGRGILILEVKGGRMELRDGCWYQNGARLNKAPREQAQNFARKLRKAVEDAGAEMPPWGVACAFPDVEFSAGPKAGDLVGLVLGARELDWCGESLPATLERSAPDRPMPKSNKWLHVLHELWGETWVPHVRLADRVGDAEERAIALNAEQLRLLDIAGSNPRALVSGGAGTGKTVVARELCLRRARSGQRVLFLCFTDALAFAVNQVFAGARARGAEVSAYPVRRYACELLQLAGFDTNPGERDFWALVSLRAACDALPPRSERPELVIVDEAQDLAEADWELVRELVGAEQLWIFQDPAQGFWSDRAIPDDMVVGATRLGLIEQQRSPVAIDALSRRYRDATFAPSSSPAPGSPASPSRAGERRADASSGASDTVRVEVVESPAMLDRVRHVVTELRRDGVASSDIAILTLAGLTKSDLLRIDRLAGNALVRADHPDAPSSIIADTFLRFKGLERPFVIVTELSRGAVTQYERRMYIALSRATVQLTIVCTPAVVAEDPILAVLHQRDAARDQRSRGEAT